MKAQDLRIGNLVKRTNKLTKEKLIIELTASCILDISANGEMSSFIYEPINLTEKQVIDFGFKNTDDYYEYYRYKHSHWLKVQVFPDGKGILLIDNKQHRFIDYVHELQNAFHILIKEELTSTQLQPTH